MERDPHLSSKPPSDIDSHGATGTDATTVSDRVGGSRRDDRAPRIPPTVFARKRDDRADRSDRRDDPPTGRDTSTMYPDFSFTSLAPRIDVTPRTDANRPDITYPEPKRDRATDTRRIEDLLSSGDIERATSVSEMGHLVEKLMNGLERKRRMDRERRGL